MSQYTLTFEHNTDYSTENFIISEANIKAHTLICDWKKWDLPWVYLCGAGKSGKTHLVAMWQLESDAIVIHSSMLRDSFLEDIYEENRNYIVEDIEDLVSEEALFHLMNYVKEQGAFLLMTSSIAADKLPTKLPDLRSRLKSALPISISPPDDNLVQMLLLKLFSDRQLRIQGDIISYVTPRIERSYEAIHAFVEQVDKYALRESRTVTKPLVKKVLYL